MPQHFQDLIDNDIIVTFTDINQLRDTNPTYSALYRLLIKPFGLKGPNLVAGFNQNLPEKFKIRSFFKLLNFKANHRKIGTVNKIVSIAPFVL